MQTGQPGTQGQPTEQVEPPQGQPPETPVPTPQANAPNSQPTGNPAPPADQHPGGQQRQEPELAGEGEGDDGVRATGGGFLVKTDAFKRLKEKERERGRRDGLEEYARAQGFDSVEAMEAAHKGAGSRPPRKRRRRRPARGARTDTGATTMTDGSDTLAAGSDEGQTVDVKELQRKLRKTERQLDKVTATNQNLSTRMKRESARAKRLRNERDAIEAEGAVRQAAAQCGVTDVDYAMRLLTRELSGKPIEDLTDFDEVKFFEDLRKGHGYLFGQRTQPATTGNGAGGSPSTPTPGAVVDGAARGSQVDATKMTGEEYRALLQKRGLSPPS